MTPVERATRAQIRAADPLFQIFVEANAGSGKTRVLVDRVARLLLSGAEPDRILCLTYTKAAAGEMKSRLFKTLGDWSITSDADLADILKKFGDAPQSGDLAKARRLFARALETPGGLAVQTIHAFCESLLKRFPLEAGVPPGFDIVDDAAAASLIRDARRDVLLAVRDDPTLGEALETIAARGADKLDLVFKLARDKRHQLMPLLANHGPDGLIAAQYAAFDLEPGTTSRDVMAQAWSQAPKSALESAALALQTGKKTEQDRAAAVLDALAARTPETAFAAYLKTFFSGGGEKTPFKSLVTKGFAAEYGSIFDLLTSEAARMDAARTAARAAQIVEGGVAALRFASAFISRYEARLTSARKLDFSDLVYRAAALLTHGEAGEWVRYKMDGGVDHILVDEAQDTGPDQWAVINALVLEFFSGDPERLRTMFCVGDEKQSIYSFQGADPKAFIARGGQLLSDADIAGMDHDSPALSVSFRSGPEVLTSVDRAFEPERLLGETRALAKAPETKFVEPDNDNADSESGLFAPARDAFAAYRPHEAARALAPGIVDIWPPLPVPPKPEDEDPTGPVDRDSKASARNQMARLVAGEIRRILNEGDAVWEEAKDDGKRSWIPRPARPDDIMVLVRRREGFFDELIRQLKLLNVPVAGADRMTLKDQLAVEDLLGVARAALNPRDDLVLAEVLKSPFFHPAGLPAVITEDALFDLAHDRRGTLWAALRQTEDERFAEAREALRAARARIETAGVYGFFSEFLTETSSTGESRLKRLFARLGEEARDPVEEFLSRALSHENESSPSLTRFVAEMRSDVGTIKREMEEARGEVRVMTVHASKGLEAPIVILPDTTQAPKGRSEGGLVFHRELGLLWSLGKDADPPLLADLREADEAATEGEYSRLLYVALTRAKDRLLVCGWKHGQAPGRIDERSWHGRLWQQWSGDGWTQIDTPVRDEQDAPLHGRRLGQAARQLAPEGRAAAPVALPDWAVSKAAEEAAPPRPIAPSRLIDDEDPPSLSPLLASGANRFRRGVVIHKLLQTLPDLAPEVRAESAARFVAREPDIAAEDAEQIVEETLRVLDHPEFAAIFGTGSRAEVSLAGHAPGLPKGQSVRGQVDRLVVTEHDVQIIDYKTNRPPPTRVEDVSSLYLAQMGAYRALLQAMHPGKPVRCALLWTDGPRLMELPADAMDAALRRAAHLDGMAGPS
tara:strand:+ start:681 stop:4274 length:3594 start_codon:yes stop_codon:yes gene_type:complete